MYYKIGEIIGVKTKGIITDTVAKIICVHPMKIKLTNNAILNRTSAICIFKLRPEIAELFKNDFN